MLLVRPWAPGVAADVAHFRRVLEPRDQQAHPLRDLRAVDAFERCAVLGRSGLGVDRQVLRRLQVERHAGDRANALAQAIHHDLLVAVRRLQVDQHAAGLQHRVVGGIDADDRAQVLDRGIGEDGAGGLRLQVDHPVVGDILRGFDARPQLARVLRREQALRDHDVEQHGNHERGERHEQREAWWSMTQTSERS